MDRRLATTMRFAVNFDCKVRLKADEVQNVGAGGMLAAELQSLRPFAELAPQEDFRKRHLPAQPSGPANGGGGPCQHMCRVGRFGPQRGPSTSLWLVPLPVPGRMGVDFTFITF